MNGRRVEFRDSWETEDEPLPGDYWLGPDGHWGGVAPNGDFVNLGSHAVTVHEDGTITARPSILVTGVGTTWHGFLNQGHWELEQRDKR